MALLTSEWRVERMARWDLEAMRAQSAFAVSPAAMMRRDAPLGFAQALRRYGVELLSV